MMTHFPPNEQGAPSEHPPIPTDNSYRLLGVEPGAPIERCVEAYDRLSELYDPRRRPADEQKLWLDCQNAIDKAMALIWDAQAFDSTCGAFVGKGTVE
jgi:hypothetical protein